MTHDSSERLYRVLRAAEWRDAQARGVFRGAAVDDRDGFIHLSTRAQLEGTLATHFAGESDLVILEIDAAALADVRWERSRGGAEFPHLYGALPLSAVVSATCR